MKLGAAFVFVLLLLMASSLARAEVISYPRVPGDAANLDYPSVKVNGTAIDTCSTAMNVGYAHCAFPDKAEIEITTREPIKTFDISPHRAGVVAKAVGNKLVFTLAKPVHLHISVNQLPRFFLFTEEPESSVPKVGEDGVFELTALGVRSSPEEVQTKQLQRAIDEVSARKGTLLIPPGIYRTGELQLKSHLTLYLAPGAVLKGTGKIADHPRSDLGTQLLLLQDCEDVHIQGRGVIDGQGRQLRLSGENSSNSRSKLLRSMRARNITVEGVILRDAGTWGVHLIESEDLRFTNVKLISNTRHDDPTFPWEMNTDGFDPDNSSRVLIERCFISSNDDSIAVKLRYGTRRDCSSIVFRNNICWTVKSALKIGSEVYEKKLSDVTFENNDVIRADRGIVVYAYDGATVEKAVWRGNHYEFIGGDTKRMLMEIKLNEDDGKGQLRDLLIQNETFESEAETPSKLQGLDATHQLENVTFDNLVIAGKKRLSAAEARIEISRHVGEVRFK
ncbi:glycosyl hydrolase family 28 protein [Roseimicrobium sp. ORNL1]|uniref:glycoside hydrolase family 28 protein n=1 Tax=Roseimicrobium sp. ORNL1 TaxID=2711231 RepID=UPI0013E0F14C|nr:glycosyl hydrolase family 28 protein [Roseimicrobium sp. ORNL1]QIF01889.1 hypothetical protein G5S37_10235 [Roseimicrobium sp. ORNL1]